MKLTPEQKLEAMSLRFYSCALWEPKSGDFYTTCRNDLELYKVVEVTETTVRTMYTEGSDTISEWPKEEFTEKGFGPFRLWVPHFILEAKNVSVQ